jgi:tetratricopeptide (TPR) repeat protein
LTEDPACINFEIALKGVDQAGSCLPKIVKTPDEINLCRSLLSFSYRLEAPGGRLSNWETRAVLLQDYKENNMHRCKRLALSVAGGCLLLLISAPLLRAQAENKPTEQKQPQAKTKAEYDAYLAMYNEQDPNKKVDLASKFLTDFPDSEFKPYIYQIQISTYAQMGKPDKIVEVGEKFSTDFPQADNNTKTWVFQRVMQAYQQQNNFEKTVEYGDKLLALNPKDLPALLTLASILPERLPQAEDKKAQQLEKAMEIAQRAQAEVNALISGPKPAQVTDQQWADEKNRLQATVLASIGLIHLNKKEYDKAIEQYEKSTSLLKNNSIDFYRLGVAYSFQARALAKELNDMVSGLQGQANPDAAAADAAKEKEKKFNEMRDKAIDALAKSVYLKGLTEQQARTELERLYKSKNNNSLDGLDAMIAQAGEALKKPAQ